MAYDGLPVTAISNSAFYGKKFEYVFIPETVTEIGERAFQGCSRLKNITIPASVENIGQTAFASCTSLKKVNFLGNKIKDIKRTTFGNCGSLTEITLPDNIQTIGFGAFSLCSNLKKIDLPAQLKVIDKAAFSRCGSLADISLPDKLQTIGDTAFFGTLISRLVIPASVILIGQGVFRLCNEIVSVEFENRTGWVRTAYYDNKSVNTETLTAEDLSDSAKVIELFNEYYAYERDDGSTTICYYIWTRTETE